MPGLYTITTRAAGTIITALIYNHDHQVHVDGRTATKMQSYGSSVTQLNVTEDPFPGGVESLPATLAGELSRLRFDIAAMASALSGGVAVNWYASLVAPGFATIGARVIRSSSVGIPANTPTIISFLNASADFNSGVWVNGAPTRFTAPNTGKYFAACSVTWAATVSAGLSKRRQLQIGVNGSFTNAPTKTAVTLPQEQQRQTITGLLNLTAADFVEFRAFQDSGDNPLNIIADVPPSASIVGALVFLGS
jgi:hypothetical protein